MDSKLIIIISIIAVVVIALVVTIILVLKKKKDKEPEPSILDVQSTGVPSDAEKDTFSYGYEKEPTIAMDPVDPNAELPKEEEKKEIETPVEEPTPEVPVEASGTNPNDTLNAEIPEVVSAPTETNNEAAPEVAPAPAPESAQTEVNNEPVQETETKEVNNEQTLVQEIKEEPAPVEESQGSIPFEATEETEEVERPVNLQPRAAAGRMINATQTNINMNVTQPIPDLVEEQKEEAEAENNEQVEENNDFEETN